MRKDAFDPRTLQLVPRWMPVAVAIITIVGTSGASYATFGLRIGNLEARADRVDVLQANRRDEYEQFKQRLAAQIQSLQDGQQSESATLAKIACRLGVIP